MFCFPADSFSALRNNPAPNLLTRVRRQALSALFYLIAAEPTHIVAAKSQVTLNSDSGSRVCYRTGSRASLYLVIVCAAAARYGVLSRHARLPDGRYEACNGVRAAAFAAASCLLTPFPVRCVGCNSDSGAQAPELDMLFEMIRTI